MDKVVEAARKMVGHAATFMVLWTAPYLHSRLTAWFVLCCCTIHLHAAVLHQGCAGRVLQQANPSTSAQGGVALFRTTAACSGHHMQQPVMVPYALHDIGCIFFISRTRCCASAAAVWFRGVRVPLLALPQDKSCGWMTGSEVAHQVSSQHLQ